MSNNPQPQSSQTKANLQKMINDYTEMKSRLIQTSALLKTEIQEKDDYIEKNQAIAIQNKTLEEENNTLKANYDLIQKRYEQLQRDLNEAKASKKSTSSYISFFTGSNKKEETNQLESRIAVLENELEIKIKENEECHVEVFEYKKQYNDKAIEFDKETEKYKATIQGKNDEIVALTNNNNEIVNMKLALENQLGQLTNSYTQLEINHNLKTLEYKAHVNKLNKHIESMNIKNKECYSIDLYSNESLLEYNLDFMYCNKKMKEIVDKQLDCISNILLKGLMQLFSNDLEKLIGNLKKRLTIITFDQNDSNYNNTISNIFDVLNTHMISLQVYIKTCALFTSMLLNEVNAYYTTKSKADYINHIILMKNILLVLIKKMMLDCISISKAVINAIKQHKPEEESIIKAISSFIEQFKVLLFKVFILFDFNEEYNDNNISIKTDNYYRLTITVSKDYNTNYQHNSLSEHIDITFLNDLFEVNLLQFKHSLDNLISVCFNHNIQEFIMPKSSTVLKQTEINQNNELIKSSCNEISNMILSIIHIKENLNDTFTIQSSLNKQIVLFVLSPQYFTKRFFNDNNTIQLQACNEISFNEAIQYKADLEKSKQREAQYNEEIVFNRRRIEEYEEKMTELKNMLIAVQTAHDLLKSKIINKKKQNEQSIGIEDTEESNNNTIVTVDELNSIEDFINSKEIIQDNECNVNVFDDKELLDGEKCSISIDSNTIKNLNDVMENNSIGVVYQRKVIEKLKRYVTWIRNIDMKYMNQEEMRLEYENKIMELTTNEKVLRDTNEENINILTNMIMKYEELKEKLCNNCKKHIKD